MSDPRLVALWAICNTCRHKHSLHNEAQGAFGYWQDWQVKHPGHDISLCSDNSEWQDYKPNADVKEAYAASTTYTITLTSLATSSTLLAGREGTAVSNTTNKYLDYMVGGRITMGTVAPTADKTIEIWLYGSVDDTPTYPDTITGSDANASITSANVKKSALRLLERIFVDATASRVYWFGPVGIAQHFGGRIPKNHGLFVVQDSGQALHATGTNHVLSYTGLYTTVI